VRKLASLAIIAAALLLMGCEKRWPFNSSNGAAAQPSASLSQGDAAKDGLATFQKLVTPQNYRGLGFTSPEDAQKAHLGDPIAGYRIGLDALKGYKQGTKIDDIMVDAKRSLYPVIVDERVATSIYVTQDDDGWRATDFGNAAVARAVTTYRHDKRDIVVQIPALKVYFVGRRTDGGVTLTAVMDDPRLGFKAGQTMSADQALSVLQRTAATYNGLPE
jgi:hypothetical protein